MKIKLFFFVILLIIGIFFTKSISANSGANYVNIADKITDKTADELKKSESLRLIGTGGQMMDNIKLMRMIFQLRKELDIDGARVLLLKAAHLYLTNINQNHEIRPYLVQAPFTIKNIEISVFFCRADGSTSPTQKLISASIIDGILSYKKDHPTDRFDLIIVKKESYNEALILANMQTRL